jgi:hypothetical protein
VKILNRNATRIFRQLIAGIEPGEARKLDNGGKGTMAVHVDCLSSHRNGIVKMYAVAHRYIQNGDSCPDPDVEFMVVTDGAEYFAVSPTAIDHAPPFGYKRYVNIEDGHVKSLYPKGQADLTRFCNTWMQNIAAQQGDPESGYDIPPPAPAAPVIMVADETARTEVTPVETMADLVHGSRS